MPVRKKKVKRQSKVPKKVAEEEPGWHKRFNNCTLCGTPGRPMRDGVIVNREARQMLVTFMNHIQVVNYENSTESEQDGPPETRHSLSYNF